MEKSAVYNKGRIIKLALTGEAREETFRRLLDRIDRTSKRADGVPEQEINAAIDEAVECIRHHRG